MLSERIGNRARDVNWMSQSGVHLQQQFSSVTISSAQDTLEHSCTLEPKMFAERIRTFGADESTEDYVQQGTESNDQ